MNKFYTPLVYTYVCVCVWVWQNPPYLNTQSYPVKGSQPLRRTLALSPSLCCGCRREFGCSLGVVDTEHARRTLLSDKGHQGVQYTPVLNELANGQPVGNITRGENGHCPNQTTTTNRYPRCTLCWINANARSLGY